MRCEHFLQKSLTEVRILSWLARCVRVVQAQNCDCGPGVLPWVRSDRAGGSPEPTLDYGTHRVVELDPT